MTQAHQCRDQWLATADCTLSLNTLAVVLGATRHKVTTGAFIARQDRIRWIFKDGSYLTVAGRGASHKTSVDDGPFAYSRELKAMVRRQA